MASIISRIEMETKDGRHQIMLPSQQSAQKGGTTAGYKSIPMRVQILEKRLKEHTDKMEQMERMMDPKATMDSLDKSAANIRSLEKSVASAAEISVSVNPLLDSLARMEKRIVELENRPQPQQSCCVVS